MRKWLAKMSGLKASRGQTTAEYAIIVALVAVSSIAIIMIFGDQIRSMFADNTKVLGGDVADHTKQFDAQSGDTAVQKNLGNF